MAAPTSEQEQPQDKNQRLVKTPYGKGLVIRTRSDGIQEVKLLEWEKTVKESKTAAKKYGDKSTQMMYTKDTLESIDPRVGDDVICALGRGTVTKIISVKIMPKKKKSTAATTKTSCENESANLPDKEEQDEQQQQEVRQLFKYEVELTSWRLAGRSKVKCYLYPPAIRVVREKPLGEMNALERVEFAERQKKSAVKVFKEKQYQQALNLYCGAVDSVRYVQHDASSSNETRADLVEVMVTCSNNAATCSAQLNRWEQAVKFAQNALVLLDALIGKKGMKIHTILIADKKDGGNGLCDAKLFGEWRVKSYLIIARGRAEKKDYEGAIEILKRAREIILEYCKVGEEGGKDLDDRTKASIVHLRVQDKEVRRLMSSCVERKKAQKKKEKQRAQAMFGSSPNKKGDVPKNTDATADEEKKENFTPPSSPLMRGGSVVKNEGGGSTTASSSVANGVDESSELSLVTPTKEIHPKIVRPIREVPRQSSLKKNRPPKAVDRRVSFSTEVSERRIESEYDGYDDDDQGTFLEQNKEALILVGIAGLAAFTVMALRGWRR